jgi:uncharacterized Tic20 family protein
VAAAKKASKTSKPAAKKAAPKPAPQAEPEAWATPPPAPAAPAATTAGWQAAPAPMRQDQQRTYAMLLHLSALVGLLIGFFFIGPLVMWIIKKDESPFVDRHGRAAVNFHLSLLLYAIGGAVLIGIIAVLTLGLGVILLIPVIILAAIALGLVSIIFPIIACLRAQAGLEYVYPLSIRFIPLPAGP